MQYKSYLSVLGIVTTIADSQALNCNRFIEEPVKNRLVLYCINLLLYCINLLLYCSNNGLRSFRWCTAHFTGLLSQQVFPGGAGDFCYARIFVYAVRPLWRATARAFISWLVLMCLLTRGLRNSARAVSAWSVMHAHINAVFSHLS